MEKVIEKKAQKIEKIEEPKINRRLVLLFLEKLEKLTEIERKEILKVIQLLNCPIWKIKMKKNKKEINNFPHDWNGQYGKDNNKNLWYWCVYCGKKIPLGELTAINRENCPTRNFCFQNI